VNDLPSHELPIHGIALDEHLRSLPPVQVLYTDLDGTLVGSEGSLLSTVTGAPTARAAQGLVAARQAGVTVVPVSGRRHAQLAWDCRLLGLADFVAETGTVICRDGEVQRWWGDAPKELTGTPREALRETGALQALLDAFDGELRIYDPYDDGRIGEYLLIGQVDVRQANELLAGSGAPWAHLIDNGASTGWPGRHARAYHLLPRGTGKARAVAEDLRLRGLSPGVAMACGDSMEDWTMAACVGTYVQVANGHGALGGNAFGVPGAMTEGFADAVDALLRAYLR